MQMNAEMLWNSPLIFEKIYNNPNPQINHPINLKKDSIHTYTVFS